MFVAGEDGKENAKRVGEKSGEAVGETARKDADAIEGFGKRYSKRIQEKGRKQGLTIPLILAN